MKDDRRNVSNASSLRRAGNQPHDFRARAHPEVEAGTASVVRNLHS